MNSFIGWVGGKQRLREEIISNFPTDHKMYVEVFGGAGWVLFARDKHAQEEVYNDINSELVNLFRCVKYHKDELKKELNYMISAREFFSDYKLQLSSVGLTDIQRAARFFYTIKYSFGSKGQHYATRGKSIANTVSRLDEIATRLNKVVIENKSYEEVISKYDRNSTLFYLDPPYYKTEKYYQRTKGKFDIHSHQSLRNILSKIKGRFVLSYNDDEYIRDLYKNFNVTSVIRKESLSITGKNNNEYKEIIITNFDKKNL